MITSERQYRIAQKKMPDFTRAIEKFNDPLLDKRTNVHERLLQAEREAMESQLQDLRKELEEYDQLKSSKQSVI